MITSRHRVPFSRPCIEECDAQAVLAALNSGWLAFGHEKERFEREFAQVIGVPHAVSANSCTSALEAALHAANIRGEVVVPSFTWVATANAVINAGATPVFCDVDPGTGNTTAALIEQVVTSRTEAILVVHYAGQPCAMDDICLLCDRYSLLMVEDSAETLGATWRGRMAGSFGIGCFSFYPTKAITTGEGGMLTTRDSTLADRARTWMSHGVSTTPPITGGVHVPWERAAEMPGHNYRMPNMLAALGVSQLQRLEAMNARRQALASRYNRAFLHLEPTVRVPQVADGATHVYQLYSVRVSPAVRDSLLRSLWDQGIGANVHFDPPVHLHPYYLTLARNQAALPGTEMLAAESISLPIYPDMTVEEQEIVIEALLHAISKATATE